MLCTQHREHRAVQSVCSVKKYLVVGVFRCAGYMKINIKKLVAHIAVRAVFH